MSPLVFGLLCGAVAIVVLGLVLRPLFASQRPLPFALLGMLTLAGFGLYLLLGTPLALDPQARRTPQTLEEAMAQLQAQLQRDPGNAEGWRLLGAAMARSGRTSEARDAFERAIALQPDDADLLVEAAEARALADPGRRFDQQARGWLDRAVAVDPAHQRARWFIGIAQRQAGDAAAAARTWEALLPSVDAPTAAALRPQIDAARVDAGLPPLPAEQTQAASTNAIAVRVRLDETLAAASTLPETANVFVIARAPGGPPMPIAAEKHPASALPLSLSLDDTDSPMPTTKLSAQREVELVARLSPSGSTTRAEGDIESAPVRVRLPAQAPVELVIGGQARP